MPNDSPQLPAQSRTATLRLLFLFVLGFLILFFAGTQPAQAQEPLPYDSYSFGSTYREAAYGNAPDGVASTEGCHFVISANYPETLSMDSPDKAKASFTLSNETVKDAAINSISVNGSTLTLDITTTYMPGGIITISAPIIDGITCGGSPIAWQKTTAVVPTGLKFHVTDVTVGTQSTCASTTIEIDHSANVRSMNHILWTSNGSSLLSGTGTSQTTAAHHHNYWSFTLQTSAQFIQQYATGLAGYVVEVTPDGYGVTLKATKPVAGEYLGIYNYDDNFLQAAGIALGDHVTGLPAQTPSTALDLSSRANVVVESAEYTGQAVRPRLLVTDGRYGTLTEGKDYSVSFENNVNYGNAQLTVTGMGAYTGSITKSFSITHALSENDFVFDLADVIYEGTPITGRVTSSTLKEGTDYIVRYLNNDKVGTASIYVIGQGNCTGTISKSFQILEPKQASQAPSTPAKPKVTVGRKSLKVSWKTSKGADSYKVQYCQAGKKSWKTVTAKTTKTTLKKLASGKKYKVRVIACNADKHSKPSPTTTSKAVK